MDSKNSATAGPTASQQRIGTTGDTNHYWDTRISGTGNT